ncbi:MAG: tetratricopeptide repeat protein, partial [Calditrichae bacterium]|nr:tetratricopeptide repeat protein [Calditrichia bacterium]NIW79729.1 tetratricopeptide repeat protein [Calditrichia bacterium]
KLAIVYATLYQWNYQSRTAAWKEKAQLTLKKAVKLAPELPEVRFARGNFLANIENNLPRALTEYEWALTRQPNNSDIINDIGVLYLRMRRFEKAAGYFKKQYELDPYQINSGGWVSAPYWLLRRWEDAENWINIYLVNHPEHDFPYVRKACIYLFGYGDLNAARAIINEGFEHVRNRRFILNSGKWIIELFSRNYREALEISFSDAGVANLRKGLIYRLMEEDDKSKMHFDSARVIYEKLVDANPEIAGWHSSLGLACAGLGLGSRAVREGEKAVELSRKTRLLDDMLNPYSNPPLRLAHIHILIGNYDTAVEQLGALLSSPGELTHWRLKLDPLYDPLRSHPRFHELLEES